MVSVLLIICVDRDDDVGKKAGVETPIVGRDAVEDAARRFGVARFSKTSTRLLRLS